MDEARPNQGQTGSSEVTRLLGAIASGQAVSDQLFPLVYDELRRLAASRLAKDAPGQTLQPTALVHEAYLRLVGGDGAEVKWQNHAHFFGAAALAMKRILIERARRRALAREAREYVTELDSGEDPEAVDLIALDEALTRLGAQDERLAELVNLRFFAGLTVEQTAEVMGASSRTVKRDWSFARAWLHRELTGGAS
jgi:RNA polymerase sigma factor (TIGR02999 family)